MKSGVCKNAHSLKSRVFCMYKIVPDPKNLKGFAVFQHERIKEERKSPSLSERGIAVEKH